MRMYLRSGIWAELEVAVEVLLVTDLFLVKSPLSSDNTEVVALPFL